MPSFVLLLNYTDEGMRNIKYLPQHVSAFRQAISVAGGQLSHVYMTMGQFDMVVIVEAASDVDCATLALGLSSLGNVRCTTLKAFGEDDLPLIVENIPSLEDEFSRILREFKST